MTYKDILCEEIRKEKKMDVTKVVIENWPKTNYLSTYIPIFIALIALCISAYSIYTTRKIFVDSHRPYVWASNYVYIDQEGNATSSVPYTVACHVKNSPARIIQTELKINLNMETVFVHTERNMVRFPDEMYEWSFDFNMDDFHKIRTRTYEAKSKLVRLISLKYSSLDGGKIYHYNLKQSFIPSANEWEAVEETAD